MYNPKHFQEGRPEVLGAFMRAHPFASLVTLGADGLIATSLPLLWDPEPGPHGMLTGHIARPNPQGANAHGKGAGQGVEALAIFSGPQAYISPGWYRTKREHGKVVPTWNYVTVHAYGPLTVIDDAEWLRRLVTRLTDLHESFSAEPWKVTDAPDGFIDQMLKGIVGIEIPLTRVEGKWKLSQNRPEPDQAGAMAGLEARGDTDSRALAEAMRQQRLAAGKK